jgi:hypothetical protein
MCTDILVNAQNKKDVMCIDRGLGIDKFTIE